MGSGLRRQIRRSAAAVLVAALLLYGCARPVPEPGRAPEASRESPAPTGPAHGGTLVTAVTADAIVLLPTLASDSASGLVNSYLYDSLLTFNSGLELIPSLAAGYSVEQNRIYTFKLRPDVRFHDGTPMTSQDVLFTFLSMAHPHYAGVRFGDFMAVRGWDELGQAYAEAQSAQEEKRIDTAEAERRMAAAYEKFQREGGLSAPDPLTFRVELSEPFAPALINIGTVGIMPRHLLEPHLADLLAAPEAQRPVGTGAYRLVEWVRDDHMTLERNPDWKYGARGHPARIDRILIKVIPDARAAMMALETGEIDTAPIEPENAAHFRTEVPGVNVVEYQGFSYTYMGYNVKDARFADPRVRRAITHAVDREAMVRELLSGHGAVANSHGSPVRWDYNPDVPVYGYDPARAEALLDEAGWVRGSDGIRVRQGSRLAFTLAINTGNAVREQAAVVIQQSLARVGIEVKLLRLEWSAFLEHVDGPEKQAFLLGWSIGVDPDAHVIFHSQGGFNGMSGYSNARVDQLIERGRQETDRKARREIYAELQRLLAEDQVYTWLFFETSIMGFSKRVGGLPQELGVLGPLWAFEDWQLMDAGGPR